MTRSRVELDLRSPTITALGWALFVRARYEHHAAALAKTYPGGLVPRPVLETAARWAASDAWVAQRAE